MVIITLTTITKIKIIDDAHYLFVLMLSITLLFGISNANVLMPLIVLLSFFPDGHDSSGSGASTQEAH